MSTAQLTGVIFAGVGALLMLLGLVGRAKLKKFLANASKANGVVTGLVARTSTDSDGGGSSTTYAPSVSFKTASGQQVDFVSAISSSHPTVKQGDSVEVLYLESNPKKAMLNYPGIGKGVASFAIVIFGALFVGGGVALYFFV